MKTNECSYSGCEQPNTAKQLCTGHYKQLRRGVPLKPLRAYSLALDKDNVPRSEAERFARFVSREGNCHEWQGYTDKAGYGHFNLSKESGYGRVQAHRYSYEKLVGMIPAGYEIDHLCFNPRCVNPEHLEAVTKEENLRRKREGHRMTLSTKSNTSGRVGVSYTKKHDLWRANLSHKGHKYPTSYHKTFEEAVAAREAMEQLALEQIKEK